MAEKQVNLALGFGTDEYAKYQAASKAMEDMLAKRENRLFDPTLLAMAQGFLAPTRTGSFGESLGNAAGAVAPVQQAEDKRIFDAAKMRLDMAERGVQTSVGLKKQQGMLDWLKKNSADEVTTPDASTPAPSATQGAIAAGTSVSPLSTTTAPNALPAAPLGNAVTPNPPVTGGLPSANMPAGAPAPAAVASAPPVQPTAPPVAQPNQATAGVMGGIPLGIPGTQGSGTKGLNLNKQEQDYFALGMNNNASPTDLIDKINERRYKESEAKDGYVFHRPSGTIYPIISPEQVEIQLPGEKSPRKVFKHDSLGYQLYSAKNDPRAQEYLNRMKYGNKMGPETPVAGAITPPASSAIPTLTDVAAERARAEAEAKEEGTGAGKRTSEAKDQVKQAIESRNTALSIKELISQPNADLAIGVFEKPTVKAAILGMVNDAVFSEEKFRDAYTKTNINFKMPQKRDETRAQYEERKQEVYDRAAQVASQAAYLQFQTSMLAKGQGTITDNERKLFAATTIGVRDSVSTMNKKADMIIERANFAQNVASRLNQNKMAIDQYRETPEYKKMAENYENKLRNIWNPTRAKAQTPTAPLSTEDLKAARRRVQERLP
jgi:hypothetical protein